MKASWYAEALYGALQKEEVKNESDSKKILARFRDVVAARGHNSLLPFIAREFEKIITREKTKSEAILVIADEKSGSKWGHAYDHYEKEGIIPKEATRRVVVDPSITGGFQIKTKDILVDGSYKKSLVELYRRIIN